MNEANLINKDALLDSLENDDDIEWKPNPFDVDHCNEAGDTPEEIMSKITFEGSLQLQTRLKTLAREFIDVFATGGCRIHDDVSRPREVAATM